MTITKNVRSSRLHRNDENGIYEKYTPIIKHEAALSLDLSFRNSPATLTQLPTLNMQTTYHFYEPTNYLPFL
jgi:hypothetical protein